MRTKPLGTTGIAVSSVLLGCGTFGGIGSVKALRGRGLDEEASHAAMTEAVGLGINVFDTAHGYGLGASEKIIGRWLATQRQDVRSGIHIATKIGVVHEGEERRIDNSPQRIAQQLDLSLERLGIERVEFCLTHFPDPNTPIEATLEGFAAAIEAGKVGHIGACNISTAQLRESLDASKRLGLPGYEWIQNEYNLLKPLERSGIFPICEKFNLGLTPFSPMAGGKLSGKYGPGLTPDPNSRVALWPGDHLPTTKQFDAIERLREAGANVDVGPGAMAVAWVLSHPLVTAAIVGPSRSDSQHLRSAREALGVLLNLAGREEISRWFEVQDSAP